MEYNNDGIQEWVAGNVDAAEKKLRKALELAPNKVTVLNNLGFLLTRKGEFAEALDHLNKAIDLEPDHASALLNRGNLHFVQKEIEKAYKDYTQSIKLNNENALAWEMYAQLFAYNNQLQEAAQAWAQAAQLAPGQHRYKLELAAVLNALGDVDKSIVLAEQVVQTAPKNVQAWGLLGVIYLNRKDYGIAQDAFYKALSIEPENEQVRLHLSWAYIGAHEYAKAKTELQRILKLNPDNETARTDLAVTLLASAELDAALDAVETVLASHPANQKASYYKALIFAQLNKNKAAKNILSDIVNDTAHRYQNEAKTQLERMAATQNAVQS